VTPRMIGLSMALAGLAWTGSAQTPASLDLVEVRIDEGPLARNEIGADRDVTFTFLLERAPECTRANDGLTYTVLMDGGAGRFVSRSGEVVVEGPTGGTPRHAIKLRMQLSGLPAHEFNWVGLVRSGARFGRVPESGEPVYWTISERALW
jgi:hypothetical protein